MGGLGVGIVTLVPEHNIEKVYFPSNSRAVNERTIVRNTFPDLSSDAFNIYSHSDPILELCLVFVSTEGNLLESKSLREITGIVNNVDAITFDNQGDESGLGDICARRFDECVIIGKFVLLPGFLSAVSNGSVTYPFWTDDAGGTIHVPAALSAVKTQDGVLVSAKVLRVCYELAYINEEVEGKFKWIMEGARPLLFKVSYGFPSSLTEEVEYSTSGEVLHFVGTLLACCVYSIVMSSGGNAVSTRALLGVAGIVATALSILGSMGLMMLCRVNFINIVGIIPFLITGIGIDDLFLLMSAWSSTLGDRTLTVPQRVGCTLKNSGVSVSITSLTDFLAFVIGISSEFRAITIFCLYAGTAVLFCYVANLTFVVACLTFHGRRVYSSRHFLTCRHAQTIRQMKAQVYGVVNLKQGLMLRDLVESDSYYYDFLVDNFDYFPKSLPISFVVNGQVDYSGTAGKDLQDLLQEARDDPMMKPDFERCWLTDYLNSSFFNSSSPDQFVTHLSAYINATSDYQADVVFDSNGDNVIASRCFVRSTESNDQYAQAHLMARLREIADNSKLPVFVYHYSFLAFDQYLAILPATLQMLGYGVASMIVVTFMFLPNAQIVSLVAVTIVMILTGIFGFMYFWNITLSPITMIHLVMSVGFCVDFSAHVCTAYLISDRIKRKARARDAVRHAASPVMNGAISTLLGVVFLSFTKSYVFVTFFKIMLLVITLGMLHVLCVVP
ncbi:patched domain-containing protein 3-like [Babylonia areolata]|uniref:patched domain-containing protein 3-like n=1 Tax=Babylonia areolata TaxID=304850 RepID=UPI003FD33B1E